MYTLPTNEEYDPTVGPSDADDKTTQDKTRQHNTTQRKTTQDNTRTSARISARQDTRHQQANKAHRTSTPHDTFGTRRKKYIE